MPVDEAAISVHGGEVFENYPAPTLVVDEDVRVLLANRAARALLDNDGDPEPALERRGGELIQCVHSFGPGGCGRQPVCGNCVVRNAVRGALSTGAVHRTQADLEIRRDDGMAPLSCLVSASPVRLGDATRVLLTLEDVTDVVRLAREAASAARAVQEAEATLGTVIDNLVEGVVASTVGGHLIHWNPAAVEMHGFTSLAECRRHLPDFANTFELLDPGSKPIPLQDWPLSRILRGEHLHELEVHVRRPDQGWKKIWRYSGSLARGANGEALLAVLTIRDVTQRRALQAQLDVASRLASLGTLVAGVAHEVNNPLAGSMASLSLAIDTVRKFADRAAQPAPLDLEAVAKGAKELVEVLEDARQGASRISRIVKDLAVFGRPDANQQVVRLKEVAEAAMKWLPSTVSAYSTIEVVDTGSPAVLGSTSQLEQVLINLVTNADKAALPGKKCRIRIELGTGVGGQARIIVSDDGMGMSRDVLQRIFDPFFTTREVGKGMGMGLPICHAIVTAHRGRIHAVSEPGAGTSFIIELPAAAH